MSKVITYNFGQDFISELASYIIENFYDQSRDISKLAIVFGGKRPALFLKKELAVRTKRIFYPPNFFSIDEFMNYILKKNLSFRYISELDACYTIYKLITEISPEILKLREKFSQFLPWAREIKAFLEELDLEDVKDKALENVQLSAEIGYEVPESINTLLKNIITIRQAYHKNLVERHTYSRGLIYLEAAKLIKDTDFPEFENILFCNFYYLHKTEEEVIKYLYQGGKAILFFQRDNREWPVLNKVSQSLGCKIETHQVVKSQPNLFIWKGFDIHSQVGLVREAVKSIPEQENTVIVLPQPESLIPLLPEISAHVKEFNVSMGYPLKRSSIYSLFSSIFKSQATKEENAYYARDYLRILMHPLVKNLILAHDSSLTRVLVHKIEEVLLGREETELAGRAFVKLEHIEELKELSEMVISTLNSMDIIASREEVEDILKQLHYIFFRVWENVRNFAQFSQILEEVINLLVDKSLIANYPLNLKVVERIYNIKEELACAEFKGAEFSKDEIFRIFEEQLENELVSFSGSPLKGMQILGLFETRALYFKNVIVMDVNESILPKLRVYEPLIPRQIMLTLGLNRLEWEEEIQRYHFMRLIAGAEDVYLIYDDSMEKVKSRFIEELIWQRQKEEAKLNVFVHRRASFNVEVLPKKGRISKTKSMLKTLKNFIYSSSSLDTYLNCPLQFYYQYILSLEPKDDLLAEPEAQDVGNFIHELLEAVFMEFLGKEPRLNNKFRTKFFKEFEERFDISFGRRMGSDAFMVKYIMEYSLRRFLEKEQARPVKQILCLEDETFGGKIEQLQFKCRIDRIDRLRDGSLLIIDYKTGSGSLSPKGLDKLSDIEISRQTIKEKIGSFQLPIYFYFVSRKFKEERINAAFYNLRDTELKYFLKEKDDAQQIMDICLKAIMFIIAEISDPKIDFEADESQAQICKACPFIYLCR